MQQQDSNDIETEETTTAETENNQDSENDDGLLKSGKYTPGEPIALVRVRFPGNAKSHPFLAGKRGYQYGQRVVAMSDRGLTIGYINSFTYEIPFKEHMLPLRSIARVADENDETEQRANAAREKEAEVKCQNLIEKHKLDMVLTHVEFLQNGKKAVFYFNAPARVDFRSLVKDLVADLRMRIELRQISVRDRTAALGAIGVCGLQTCCSSFLSQYGSVNIKMPKNQNLALIPSKINGVCGQIKCCMKYEDEVYAQKRNVLPRIGEFVQTAGGDCGKVYRLYLLVEQFEMMTDKGKRRRYSVNQFDKNKRVPKDWKFPNEFDYIYDETNEVIGLEPIEEKRTDESLFSFSDAEKEETTPEVATKPKRAEKDKEKNEGQKKNKRNYRGKNRGSRNNKKNGGDKAPKQETSPSKK